MENNSTGTYDMTLELVVKGAILNNNKYKNK